MQDEAGGAVGGSGSVFSRGESSSFAVSGFSFSSTSSTSSSSTATLL